jgi:transposase
MGGGGDKLGRVRQPVLPLLPASARSVGPSAGLLEGPEGGVVFVFGLATFTFAAGDEAGRRLAAVQLVNTKVATGVEVAAAFGVTAVTVWRWGRAFTAGGVAGLVPDRTGPKGPTKLTGELAARIGQLDREGLSLRQIADRTQVSTATVRVALGRVRPGGSAAELAGPDLGPDIRTDPAAGGDPGAGVGTGAGADLGSAGGTELAGGARPAVGGRPVEGGCPAGPDGGELVVLAAPVPRTAERAAARAGQLLEAPVVITQGASLPLAGLLLALPALEGAGLLAAAEEVFGRMRPAFYGLRATLLTGVFLALLREPRAEGATRIGPADLGRLLGLDRAPEVKTLRRKLAELAGHGQGAAVQAALARRHAAARPDAIGFLYLDGHVRVYSGTRQLPKTHITRMRIAGPATEETWVCDRDGDPVLVLTAAPSASLASELRRTLPDLRNLVGTGRRCTVVFDRGGYSPAVFAEIIAAGFDLLTYYKGSWTRSAPTDFTDVTFPAPDGSRPSYQLAERAIELTVPAVPARAGQPARPASTLPLRLVVRRTADGHQTPILTNRTDLTAAELAYRMAARWRQENYFKYAREHFALDALDSYADTDDDPDRPVPNPAKAAAHAAVRDARTAVTAAHAGISDAIGQAATRARQPGSGGHATVDPAAEQALTAAQTRLTEAQAGFRDTPSHRPLGQVRPGSRRLETERKLLTHAIRMSAYNAESSLARLLRPHYARGDDEARALLREAFTLPGDLQIHGGTLHVRLDPASAPRRSRALAGLCTDLTDTASHYPGTDLTIAYSVKDQPRTT